MTARTQWSALVWHNVKLLTEIQAFGGVHLQSMHNNGWWLQESHCFVNRHQYWKEGPVGSHHIQNPSTSLKRIEMKKAAWRDKYSISTKQNGYIIRNWEWLEISLCIEICGIDPGEHPGRSKSLQFVHAIHMQRAFISCGQNTSFFSSSNLQHY